MIEAAGPDSGRPSVGELVKHGFVACAWIGCFVLLARYSARALPLALARELTLHAFLCLVHLVTTAVGLGMSALLLGRSLFTLGLRGARWGALGWALLLAAPAYVVANYAAIWVARPTLLAELAQRGRQAVQADTGEFGRQLAASPVWLTIVWAVVISVISEELMFRGALWSFVQRVVERVSPRAPQHASPSSLEVPLAPSLGLRAATAAIGAFRGGGVATVVSAGVFASLHADMPGGVGIVRVVSALGLGLFTGLARQLSGRLWAPILLHAAYNLMSLATLRRWVVSETFPLKWTVPTLLTLIAALCVAVALVIGLTARLRRRT